MIKPSSYSHIDAVIQFYGDDAVIIVTIYPEYQH